MLTHYIDLAMHKANYELLEDRTFYGEIPDCRGVWATAQTLEACQVKLARCFRRMDYFRTSLGSYFTDT